MSEAELISLFVESSQALDANFEFWLTVSFALVVASYLVAEKIPVAVYGLTTTLYLAASALFMLRGHANGRMLTSIRDQLDAMGSTITLITPAENTLVATLYLFIMIGGTFGTIAFVFWRARRLPDGDG